MVRQNVCIANDLFFQVASKLSLVLRDSFLEGFATDFSQSRGLFMNESISVKPPKRLLLPFLIPSRSITMEQVNEHSFLSAK
jgi:hypothetical protein